MAASGAGDPFYVVKDELAEKLATLQGRFSTFKNLLKNTNTATSTDFRDVRKGIQKDMRSCEKKLKDLSLTVDLVQNDRAQFAHIDDFELEKRAEYIADMRKELEDMQAYYKGDEVRRKMIADERLAVEVETGALGATNSDEAENTHFIVGKQAEARMIMQQQDEDLTELGHGVDRLNELSQGINAEIKTQNQMLSDLDRDIDEAAEKMNFVMGKLAKLLKTKDTCQICVVIWLTFILIILVLLVIYT